MKIFKILLILILPAIAVHSLYLKLSPSVCFLPTDIAPTEVEKFVEKNLNTEYTHIQSFSPLIQFGEDWFKYDVWLENEFKVAIVIDKIDFYKEATGTIMLATQFGTSTIPFGQNIRIARSIVLSEIPNLMTGFSFITESPLGVVTPPNTNVRIETNRDKPLCIYVHLEDDFSIPIYATFLLFLIGFLVAARELVSFIYKDFGSYFTSS